MTKDEQKILRIVKEGGGNYWTNKIARLADIETSSSTGNHQNWKAYDILIDLEARNLVKSKGGGRGKKRYWRVA